MCNIVMECGVLQLNSELSCEGTPLNSRHSRIMASRMDWYGSVSHSPSLQSVDFRGKTVRASPLFSCCLILPPDRSTKFSGGEFRGVVCMKPDKRLAAEVLMSSYGFSTSYRLSQTLVTLSNHLQYQVQTMMLFIPTSLFPHSICMSS